MASAFDGSKPDPSLGYFTYTVAGDHWSWSDGIYALHGFAPREVPATTEVLLRHKHPDDRARTFEVLERAVQNGEPFSCYHRIIDVHEQVRSVLSVGRAVRGTDGQVEQLVGFFIDLTEVRRVETENDVQTALVRIAETRSVIDQAKGILMFTFGCDADAAFDILRRYSQNANIKLSSLAHRLVEAARHQLPVGDQSRTAVLSYLGQLGSELDLAAASSGRN